jgi:hypothetical protein
MLLLCKLFPWALVLHTSEHLFFIQVWCQNGTQFFLTITFLAAAKLLRSTSAWQEIQVLLEFLNGAFGNINGHVYCENHYNCPWTKLKPFTVSRWWHDVVLNKTVTVNNHFMLGPYLTGTNILWIIPWQSLFLSLWWEQFWWGIGIYHGNHSGGELEYNSCTSVIETVTVKLLAAGVRQKVLWVHHWEQTFLTARSITTSKPQCTLSVSATNRHAM